MVAFMARRLRGALRDKRSMMAAAAVSSCSAGTQRAMRPRSAMRLGGQGVAQQQDLPREHRAAHLEQLLGEEPRRGQPHLGERHAEAGVGRRHDEVAVQRQLVAAGDGGALHHGHDRQRPGLDPVEQRLDVLILARGLPAGRGRRRTPALGPDHGDPLVGPGPRVGVERVLQGARASRRRGRCPFPAG